MAKLLDRLAVPGQPGCPGFVRIAFVPDPELDRTGVWSHTTVQVIFDPSAPRL